MTRIIVDEPSAEGCLRAAWLLARPLMQCEKLVLACREEPIEWTTVRTPADGWRLVDGSPSPLVSYFYGSDWDRAALVHYRTEPRPNPDPLARWAAKIEVAQAISPRWFPAKTSVVEAHCGDTIIEFRGGFTWGYGGEGPHGLAKLVMLTGWLHIIGPLDDDPEPVWDLAMPVISRLPQTYDDLAAEPIVLTRQSFIETAPGGGEAA